MRHARGNAVASAEISAPVTSAGAAASPSDCDSSSQRRTCSRSVSTSRRERDDRPREQPEHDERRDRDRDELERQRAPRRGEDRARADGRWRASNRAPSSWHRRRRGPCRRSGRHAGLHALPRADLLGERRVPRHARSSERVSCCPSRSSMTRSSNPRPIACGILLAGDGESSSAPASTPVIFPLASRVGTATTTTCRLREPRREAVADVRPAGRHDLLEVVAVGDVDARPVGASCWRRGSCPARRSSRRPPLKSRSCSLLGWTRLKYAAIAAVSPLVTDGERRARRAPLTWPAKYVSKHDRGEHDTGLEVVQRALLGVVVLAPGEHRAERDEHEHGDDPRDGEPPPELRCAAPERRLEAACALVGRRRRLLTARSPRRSAAPRAAAARPRRRPARSTRPARGR